MRFLDNLVNAKKRKKKWVVLTAYDAPTAEIVEQAGVDWILVGDSLGMVVLGSPSTAEVTMDEMLHHCKAARRGAPNSFIIGDMPLKGVDRGPRHALVSAHRFLDEGRCDAVKVEWGPKAQEIVERLIGGGIPVMGHLGLTPQTAAALGGFRTQAREAGSALETLRRAKFLEKLGVFSLILECVPADVGKAITKAVKIPVIGIGAGPYCDGQVLVIHDVVGLFSKFTPRFAKRYCEAGQLIRKAVGRYAAEVRSGRFPQKKHSFGMDKEELRLFLEKSHGH